MSIKIGQKNYLIKIFPSDYSVQESSIADARVTFYTSVINSGLGEFQFQVERTIQDWNTAGDLDLNKVIELWVNDIDTTDFIRVYVGYISRIGFKESRDKRTMNVTCLGFVSRLSKDILKNGTQTTLFSSTAGGLRTASPAQSVDPSTIFKGIVDRLRNASDGNIPFLNYGSAPNSTVDDTSTTIQATFKQDTYFEAIEKCRKLAPANWFWTLDADGVFNFLRKPSVAVHTFALGNIDLLEVDYSLEEITNGVLIFDNASTYRFLNNSNSIDTYGRRVVRKIASNADDTEAMDKIANSVIGENKDPRAIITVTVIDNNEGQLTGSGVTAGYDIESIKVGQTCRISGIADNASQFLSINMSILRVTTFPERAVVDVEVRGEDLSKFLVAFKKEQEDIDKDGIPNSYTAV